MTKEGTAGRGRRGGAARGQRGGRAGGRPRTCREERLKERVGDSHADGTATLSLCLVGTRPSHLGLLCGTGKERHTQAEVFPSRRQTPASTGAEPKRNSLARVPKMPRSETGLGHSRTWRLPSSFHPASPSPRLALSGSGLSPVRQSRPPSCSCRPRLTAQPGQERALLC